MGGVAVKYAALIVLVAVSVGCITPAQIEQAGKVLDGLGNVAPAVTNAVGPIVGPVVVKPVEPGGNVAIVTDPAVKYIGGDKRDKGGGEIHKIWGRTNLRIYNDGGSLRKAGIPVANTWFYIDPAVIPEGSFTYRTEGIDAILTGKDFTSKRTGNRYRFEGFHIGKEGMPLRRFSTFRVPIAELGSEATIWNWSTVAK
jgi:hypothetical protein